MQTIGTEFSMVAWPLQRPGYSKLPCLCQTSEEPLIPSVLLKCLWQKLGSDLFELQGKLVNCFSHYAEVIKLQSTTSSSVISAMKNLSFPDMEYQSC